MYLEIRDAKEGAFNLHLANGFCNDQKSHVQQNIKGNLIEICCLLNNTFLGTYGVQIGRLFEKKGSRNLGPITIVSRWDKG